MIIIFQVCQEKKYSYMSYNIWWKNDEFLFNKNIQIPIYKTIKLKETEIKEIIYNEIKKSLLKRQSYINLVLDN